MADNKSLRNADKAKVDEFYTQLSDIEKELRHYRTHFKDKTVLCNCDDPFESNFFKYFVLNFNRLGLKKLIATSYAHSPIMGNQLRYKINDNGQMSIFFGDDITLSSHKQPYKAVVTKVYDTSGDGGVDMLDVARLFESGENTLTALKEDGDFRSAECLALLDEADIVATNPPFSLFREYISALIKHNKSFVILGNMNALTYKDVFSLILNNKIWAGHGFNLSMVYKTPYPNILEANRKFVISKGYDPNDGYVKVPGIMWFTNLDIKKRHEELILIKKYSPEKYPKYDNYEAINVDKTVDIPCDYNGIIGVPITFMDKYSPEQFEIVNALNRYVLVGNEELNDSIRRQHSHACNINGKATYFRVLIRNKHPEQPKGEQQ